MRVIFSVAAAFAFLASTGMAAYVPRRTGNFDFPVYTNQGSGKQLTGVYAPTATPPLAPGETEKKFQVPKGFEVRLFASEPEVVNPVAMSWDPRGRLWVLELYEYPKGVPKGQKGRDRIKILEDTDADGRADKVTVFAEGYSLATGLLVGNGGVYLGVAPDLLFLEDTNGDDKADRTTLLKTGFGLEDRHELLNGFAWGPDGWLYLTHGVFTHSKVRDPDNPEDDGVRMDAALARFHPRKKKFEVFADGTSNPWGVDWNERGDAFVSACVIQHLFHMAPGGQYNRQGGTWPNPFGYASELPTKGLPAIVDWRHFRAAHAGICIYQGDQWPAEWRGLVYIGNIHESAINCDRLTEVGSTYRAERETKLLGPRKGDYQMGGGTFLACDDRWFRPVSVQTGPDGAMWIMDWSDKYPCYQNAQADPEGVDRELGRIWRVVWVGDQPGKAIPSRPTKDMDLAKLSTEKLAGLLEHDNTWQRRMAQHLLSDGRDLRIDVGMHGGSPVHKLAESEKHVKYRLAALWSLHSAGELEDDFLEGLKNDHEPAIRAWVARLTGERGQPFGAAMTRLARLAKDTNDFVRLAVAVAARQFVSGSLTVNTPPSIPLREVITGGVLSDLHKSPFHPEDPVLPFIYWMALEPIVAFDPSGALGFLEKAKDQELPKWPMNNYVIARIMRRICDLSDPAAREKHLNYAMQVLGGLAKETNLANAALDGLINGFKGSGQPPTIPLEPIFAKLTANPAIAEKARRLATLLGDTSASRSLVVKVNDSRAPLEERLRAVQAAREAKDEVAREELLKLFKSPASEVQPLYAEAVRALGTFGGDDIAYVITDAWKKFTLPTRRVASEVLVLRSKWRRALLAGVDQKVIAPDDISATARRALARADDATVRDHADRVLGKYRATAEEKLKVIAQKRKVTLTGQPDLKAGHEVARKACFVCHKLHGEGADVGPDLTGVGRSNLDALLHNIIDPNEVIGRGYETTEVELKDGRTISGRIVEDTQSRLKLVASGPTEYIVPRNDIVPNGVRTSEISLMPEGLEQIPDEDFRNMVWYLLNPPQDNRPMSPQLWKELVGEEPVKKTSSVVDGESVALWNPDWQVLCPPFEGAPQKLSSFAGANNVLMTHPAGQQQGAALQRVLEVPTGKTTTLKLKVAAHEKGDWELRVLADSKVLHKQRIDSQGERWKTVTVDLSQFAGKSVQLRLENAANGWSWEFGYWGDIAISHEQAL